MLDGGVEEVSAAWEGEFHGVRVSEFFRNSGRKGEGVIVTLAAEGSVIGMMNRVS